ncbi:MAG: DUF1501 domain-containing protein [Bryobacteraceae bacterium]
MPDRPQPERIQGAAARCSRRELLFRTANGFAGIAMAYLAGRESLAADPRNELNGGLHHRAKVRRVIQLFMNGGASQLDTFDYKPVLVKRHGERPDPKSVDTPGDNWGAYMKSPFEFKQYGQSGRWVSSMYPQLAQRVDDIAFLMAMTAKTNTHGPASFLMNTGFLLPGFPSMGAWISYGLGTLNDNLPTFVVLPDARGLPYNQTANFQAGFLPMAHQGTVIYASSPNPIPDLFPAPAARYITGESTKDGLRLLEAMNRRHLAELEGESALEARIASYELAARMQVSAPEVFDLAKETEATRKLYGLDRKETEDFGRRCLMARRMVERGVRFVQVWSGPGGASSNWDNHSSIEKELPPMAVSTDQPMAGLLTDLKARGLLEDTLVVWSTEFGRTPYSQGGKGGRDHNGGTFVAWMAGAGISGGVSHGESDELGAKAATGITRCYDLHATILHLMGVDHTRLTYRHNGIGRRLTDVHGQLIREVLA